MESPAPIKASASPTPLVPPKSPKPSWKKSPLGKLEKHKKKGEKGSDAARDTQDAETDNAGQEPPKDDTTDSAKDKLSERLD